MARLTTRKLPTIRLEYFYGCIAITLFLLLSVSFIVARESLFPSTIVFPGRSRFPETTSGIDWRHNFFEPFFSYVVALKLHSISLLSVFVVIPLLGLGFSLIFVKNFVEKQRGIIKVFIINLATLCAAGISLLVFISYGLSPYINDTRYRENAKFVRLNDFSFQTKGQNTFVSKLSLESDLKETVMVWGGINYCFFNSGKQLFCKNDYPQDRQRGFNYSINPGKNEYSSVLIFDQSQYERLIETGNLSINIVFIGQDASLVKYERSLRITN